MKVNFAARPNGEAGTNSYTAEVTYINDEKSERHVDYLQLEVEGNLGAVVITDAQGCKGAKISYNLSSIIIRPSRELVPSADECYIRLNLVFNRIGRYKLLPKLRFIDSLDLASGEPLIIEIVSLDSPERQRLGWAEALDLRESPVEKREEHRSEDLGKKGRVTAKIESASLRGKPRFRGSIEVEERIRVYKTIVAGEHGVGKTTLVVRYCEGIFAHDTRTTVGVGFASRENVVGDETVKLQIWDFGGEERFRFILPAYCKGADSAILAFDTTCQDSTRNLSAWVDIIRLNAGDIPIVLIGTKIDLEDERKVTSDQARVFVSRYKLDNYLELSSKTGFNVEKVFNEVAQLSHERLLRKLMPHH